MLRAGLAGLSACHACHICNEAAVLKVAHSMVPVLGGECSSHQASSRT